MCRNLTPLLILNGIFGFAALLAVSNHCWFIQGSVVDLYGTQGAFGRCTLIMLALHCSQCKKCSRGNDLQCCIFSPFINKFPLFPTRDDFFSEQVFLLLLCAFQHIFAYSRVFYTISHCLKKRQCGNFNDFFLWEQILYHTIGN